MGLQGFGNNNSGSFTPGDAIYAKQLNRMADYADRAAVGVSDGVIYQSHAGGLALSNPPIDSTRNILPFTVSVVLDGSNWKYSVFPGTLNNVIPKMGSPPVVLTNNPPPTATFGKSLAENQLEYIYIASSPLSEEPYTFPDPNNCKIINDSSPQTDDDNNSYLLIATVNQKTGAVTQMVNSSLWGSRFKCGAEQATYWYSRV
jgi:hypothetical protein